MRNAPVMSGLALTFALAQGAAATAEQVFILRDGRQLVGESHAADEDARFVVIVIRAGSAEARVTVRTSEIAGVRELPRLEPSAPASAPGEAKPGFAEARSLLDAALLESLEEPPAAPEVPILWRDLVPAAELLYGPLAEGVHAASFRGLLYYAGPLPRARVARRSAGRTVLFP